MRSENGFTLIELLTVIAIIGLLSALGLQGFNLYRQSAAFAASIAMVRQTKTAVAHAKSDPDNPPAAATGWSNTPGLLPVGPARDLFVGVPVPKNMLVSYAHDPACAGQNDLETAISWRHCAGAKYIRWEQYCDGVELELEVAGAGCAPPA